MIIKSDKGIGTESAITFFQNNRKKLKRIVRVEMGKFFDPETKEFEDYPLHLIDEDHNQMWIAGVASGFAGEGSYGLLTILEEGCSHLLNSYKITEKQLRLVILESSSFVIS
jgi:hypothetical protein